MPAEMEPLDNSSDEVTEEDSEDSPSENDDEIGGRMSAMESMAEVARYACKRKTLKAILEDAAKDAEGDGMRLGLFDLLCIGIGSTIGSGVFVLTGEVLPTAGPAATLSWICAGFACLLSGLSYMELSARLPTKGSCYIFSYHSLGEFSAVVGAVCLTLEYGISGAGVARSWSKRVVHLFGDHLEKYIFIDYPHLGRGTRYNPQYQASRAPGSNSTAVAEPPDRGDAYIDWLAALVMAASVGIIALGGDCGKLIINGFTVVKCCLCAFMIILALTHWNQSIFESWEVFAPRSSAGIIDGATLLFFGFIGFDEVCCLASRAKDPAKTMPRAIGGTLLGATVISGLAQLALSCISPPGADATDFGLAFTALGMGWAGKLVLIGETVLLPLVVFVSFLPQPELVAAMAEDGLLPSQLCAKDSKGVYVHGTIMTGVIMILMSLVVPFSVLWDVISLGVLLGFNLTNASLIQLRYRNGGAVRSQRISLLTWSAMVLSWAGCYMVWKGYAKVELDSSIEEEGSQVALCLGAALVIVGMSMIGVIAFTGRQIAPAGADIFQVPLVPWVPGLGFLANNFMMATIGWSSHFFFLALLAVTLVMFAATRITKKVRTHKWAAEVMKEQMEAKDKRIAELEGQLRMLQANVSGSPRVIVSSSALS